MAPDRRARRIWAERSDEPAGSVSRVATDSGFSEKAFSMSAEPSWPYALSSWRSPILSFFGIRYSA